MASNGHNHCEPNASPNATDEFSRGADRWMDDVDGSTRRAFLKRMAAGLALAGVGGLGCSSRPEGETIVPYVDLPDGMVPGLPTSYATSMPFSGFARGLLVTSREGRPIKIEGNPDHPSSLGGTDAFAQASILDLYDPTRSKSPTFAGTPVDWSAFFTALDARIAASGGKGLRVLTGAVTSPTLIAQLDDVMRKYPDARWHTFEPLDPGHARAGTRLAYGRDADVVHDLSKANVIVSLDADFLVDGPGSIRAVRDFATNRRVRDDRLDMNRLYVAESALTLTGGRADHRLPCRPSEIGTIAAALAAACGALTTKPAADDRLTRWATVVAADLLANRGRSLVIVGATQPPAVHAMGHAINAAIGSVGATLRYVEPISRPFDPKTESLAALTADIEANAVATLLILGGDPTYAAPGDVYFTEALTKLSKARAEDGSLVHFTAHLSPRFNATSFACQWHVPEAHSLESWGDLRGHDGTASIVQPLIAPLFNGMAASEIIDRLLGRPDRGGYAIVREHWLGRFGADEFEARWRDALKRGAVDRSAAKSIEVGVPAIGSVVSREPTKALEISLRPDPSAWDGTFFHNAWMQELPRPFTKIVWDHAALLGIATAKRFDVVNGDIVRVTLDDRWVELPVCILPGTPDGTVTLHVGYGQRSVGADADTTIGANVFGLRAANSGVLGGATLRKLNRRHDLVQTRSHFAMAAADFDANVVGRTMLKPRAVVTPEVERSHPDEENRRLVRAASIGAFKADRDLFKKLGGESEAKPLLSLYPGWDYSAGYQWGMSIDQTACIGCNACVVACQSENNIPVVGKEQVGRQREMHWLRIDDYFAGSDAENPQVHHQPVPCMHCENAPCEVVCPVGATNHSVEGLNQMIYNRCVGTRYCSNNCPYKVRRFNFLDYTYKIRNSREEHLAMNPEVTIRSRGVMEKCSYCVQRLQQTRITAERITLGLKERARQTTDATEQKRLTEEAAAREFAILDRLDTACAQACPTRAITFGSILPVAGKATRLMDEKRQPTDYVLLRELTTKPRTSYQGRLTNPNPAMAEGGLT